MSSKNFVQQILETSEPVNTDTNYLKDNESWKFSVARVMLTGIIKNQYYRSEDEIAKESVTTLMKAAKKDPAYLLKATAFARDLNMKGMVKVAICAIAGNASDDFLNDLQNRKRIVSVLSTFHPKQLMQFVDLQKSKAFGRGFGSRPQKWLQDVIKSWLPEKLERYTVQYRSDMNKPCLSGFLPRGPGSREAHYAHSGVQFSAPPLRNPATTAQPRRCSGVGTSYER